MEKGKIYLFTGEGKGKTSAALGTLVRASLRGNKVCWISWYKGEDWEIAEKSLAEKLEGVEMYFAGEGFYLKDVERKGKVRVADVEGGKVVDKASERKHKSSVREGLRLAREKIESGEYFLVVLDEVVNALDEGLIERREFFETIKQRGEVHLVLTGRGAGEDLIERADLVTKCRKIKHPYDEGVGAVKGLDY